MVRSPQVTPCQSGITKKTTDRGTIADWRSLGRTVEDALRVFVEINFENPQRLPNYLPSMPLTGKIRNIWAHSTNRFVSSNDSVQKFASFWWLFIIGMMGLLLGLNSVLSARPHSRKRDNRSKKMQQWIKNAKQIVCVKSNDA